MLVEGAVCESDHKQLVGEMSDGFELLLLQLAQIAVDPEVAHVFGVLLNLADEVLVGGGGGRVGRAVRALAVHEDLLAHEPQLLHLAFQLGVLGDISLVDRVQLGLH